MAALAAGVRDPRAHPAAAHSTSAILGDRKRIGDAIDRGDADGASRAQAPVRHGHVQAAQAVDVSEPQPPGSPYSTGDGPFGIAIF